MTDSKNIKKRENYWIKTFKAYSSFELNIEDSVWPVPCSSINFTGEFTFFVLFGILVRPGTDLGLELLGHDILFKV